MKKDFLKRQLFLLREAFRMRKAFQIIRDPRFHLLYGISQRFSLGPEPKRVRLNREGFTLLETTTKKALVHPYMPLSIHPSPLRGDSFSPVFGQITEINKRSIFVETMEPTEAQLASLAEARSKRMDLISRPEQGKDLVPVLKSLGLNTRSLGQECETLIVNGLNPDPGVTWAEPMLLTHLNVLLGGIAMLRRLSPAKKIILAVPWGMRMHKEVKRELEETGLELATVPALYPYSLNPLLIRSVTGSENPDGIGVVGIHNVWSLGRVVQTGLPLIETVVTIGSLGHSGNYLVKEGTTVGELLEFANIRLADGDTLVRGGPLRGESLEKFDRSLTKGSTGVFVVESGTVPPMQGHSPCIDCGACVIVCPARLNPAALSRNSEFALHERNKGEYIDSCMECGLCGYVCQARRPVLQYIRLSKQKLKGA